MTTPELRDKTHIVRPGRRRPWSPSGVPTLADVAALVEAADAAVRDVLDSRQRAIEAATNLHTHLDASELAGPRGMAAIDAAKHFRGYLGDVRQMYSNREVADGEFAFETVCVYDGDTTTAATFVAEWEDVAAILDLALSGGEEA